MNLNKKNKKQSTIFLFRFRLFLMLLLSFGITSLAIAQNNSTDCTVIDIDGNTYNTVTIGTQTWMAENLKVTKYNDNTDIFNQTDLTKLGTIGAYCNYNNTTNADTINTYGRLYNWYAVNTAKLCPSGWHVPSDDEWKILENYLIANGYNYDGTTTEDKIAKSLASTTGWDLTTKAGAIGSYPESNNSTGFSALPAGCLEPGGGLGYFSHFGSYGHWWSSSEVDYYDAGNRRLNYYHPNLDVLDYDSGDKRYKFSVRCLRDDISSGFVIPNLLTAAVFSITSTSAKIGGIVTCDGGSTIIEKGICWSIYQNPTINDNKINDGKGAGNFTSTLTGLSANVNYYARAYARNSKGTGYGNEISFTTFKGILLELNNSFINTQIGNSVQLTLRITNNDSKTLNISSITYPSTVFTGNWSGSIAPGTSQDLTVTFTPTDAITYSGNVIINSDATSGVNTIPISGTGVAIPVPVVSNIKVVQSGINLNVSFDVTDPGGYMQKTLTVWFGKVGEAYANQISYSLPVPSGSGAKSCILNTQNYPNFFTNSGNYECKVQAVNYADQKALVGNPGSDNGNNKVFYYVKPPSGGVKASTAVVSSITLNATASNNKVSLTWNSIPDADFYKIYRNNVYVKSVTSTQHPISFFETDNIQTGVFQYQIIGTNTSGSQLKQSNVVSISATTPVSNTIKYGAIIGTIIDASGNKIDGVSLTFSHDGTSIVSGVGNYSRSNIPFGTSGTISLSKYGYTFNPVGGNASYSVNNNVSRIHFTGTKLQNTTTTDYTNVIPVNYELEMASAIDGSIDINDFKIGSSYSFDISFKNICYNTWTGNVTLLLESSSGNKFVLDKKTITSLSSNSTVLVHFTTQKPIDVNQGSYKLQVISNRINTLNTTYLDVNTTSLYSSKINITVKPSVSNLKSMEDYLSDIKDALDNSATIVSVFGKAVGTVSDGMDMNIGNNIYSEIAKELKASSEVPNDAIKILSAINSINTMKDIVNEPNDLRRWLRFNQYVLKKAFPKPFNEIFSGYIDVTLSFQDAINRILRNEFILYPELSFRYSHIEIKVKKKSFWGFNYFDSKEVSSQIESIEIIGKHQTFGSLLSVNVPKYESIGAYAEDPNNTLNDKKVLYGDLYNINDYDNGGYKDFTIKITWRNGRVSYLPLISDFVKFDGYSISIFFQSETSNPDLIPLQIHLTK